MRGLPFPPDAFFNREQSHDFGSPGPNGTPALSDVLVPLDPILGGPRAGPAYFQTANGMNAVNGHILHQDMTHPSRSLSPTSAFQRYAQGPQGDPFAPQLPLHFFSGPSLNTPTGVQMQAAQKPVKRKRRPRREEECGFCGGNDSKNRHEEAERMVACDDCSRSGHPSCMELGEIGETIRSYPWKCVECKSCEICQEKGDDERILFCDNCDRGWHMYCLDPPLEDNPDGSWYCPLCAPPHIPTISSAHQSESQPLMGPEKLAPEPEIQIDPALQMDMDIDIDPTLREVSVASSSLPNEKRRQSRSKVKTQLKGMSAKDRQGKWRAAPTADESEGEEIEVEAVDEVEEGMHTPVPSTSKGRTSANGRRKSNARSRRRSESIPDDVEPPSPPLRPQKRMKLTMRSRSPPSRQKQSGSTRPKMVVRLRLPQTKGKGKAREEEDDDESKKGLFDDVLNAEDRDTSKTAVLNSDKDRFEKARIIAESKVVPPPPIEPVDLLAAPGPSTGRFPLRSVVHQLQQQQAQSHMVSTLSASPTPSTPGPSNPFTRVNSDVLRIRTIRFGPFDIQTWYDAPFPEEFSNIPEGRLWICEFCLKYMKSKFGAQRHRLKCKCRHPPGDEIYRDGNVSIFEVDGRKNKIYCQNLCLLSKMFLDHKSLFYDVEPFLFYVMTEVDDIGARFVGYFSKEKRSSKDLNLSCITTLPVRQRQGWGNLLIDFSYLLSRKEQRSGTPERPLSALGAIGYKKYWILAIMRYLQNAPNNPRLEDISAATAMNIEDIYLTLVQENFITVHEGFSSPVRPSPGRSIKINRSRKNGIARRNLQKAQSKEEDKASNIPFVPPTSYEIHWDREKVERFLADWKSKGYLTLKPERLKWSPFLVSRSDMITNAPELAAASVSNGGEAISSAETAAAASLAAMSASNSATPSVNVADIVDVVDYAPQAMPKSEAETAAHVAYSPNADEAIVVEPATEREQDISESEETTPTPTPSPSPVSPLKPRPSTNGLEALAAVAVAVSKANRVDLRWRPSNALPLDGDAPKMEWKESAFNIVPEGSLQSVEIGSLRTSVNTRSRQNSKKNEGLPVGVQMQFTANGRSPSPRRLRSSQVTSPVVSELNHARTPTSPRVAPRNSVEQDAELAAQLAREEGSRRRSLRSSNSVAATTSLTTRDLRPKETVRKLRKASPVRKLSPPTPLSLDRPRTRRQAQAQAMAVESAKANSGHATRQSSRLSVNSGISEAQTVHTASLRTSSRLNGVSNPVVSPSPAKLVRGQQSPRDGPQDMKRRTTRGYQHDDRDDGIGTDNNDHGDAAAVDAYADADADAEGESDVDADGEPDVPSDDDVKMEELNGHIDLSSNGKGRVAIVDARLSTALGDLSVESNRTPPAGLAETVGGQTPGINGVSPLTLDMFKGMRISAPDDNLDANATMDVEGDDIDAEGEPDDEDADGEPDPDVYQ